MIRIPIIAGNWKMQMTVPEAMTLVGGIKSDCADRTDVEVILGPPFTALHAVANEIKGAGIGLAAQNMHAEAKGAFTGEISAPMLLDAGCTHVIIGHSERRQYFGETDETVRKKTESALAAGLVPVVCIGETYEQRQGGQAFDVIKSQLAGGLAGFVAADFRRMVVAYEPVWAIGTGLTASPEQAQEIHLLIRDWLTAASDAESAATVRVLYGGSVKPDNVKELMAKPDIDGALVGGAALKADSFLALVNFNR